MTQIVNLLLDSMVTYFTNTLNVGLADTDLLHVDLIKKGLLQEDKTKKNIQLGVEGGDHEDPNYLDGIVTMDDFKNIAMHVPPREFAGGQAWWRRGVVYCSFYFVRERLVEDEATQMAYEVLGEVEAAIENMPLVGLKDSYGEYASNLFAYSNTFFESGGPPKTFIFRGKVFWAALTWRP